MIFFTEAIASEISVLQSINISLLYFFLIILTVYLLSNVRARTKVRIRY
jgi:hypothetical protein